jgi:AcrR family transcriptional regulator
MPRPPDPHAKIDLLRAAESVFAEKGLTAAKIEDITQRAGVSKGAFYLHFESKDDCFRQIVEAFLAHMGTCVEPPPAVQHANFASAGEAIEACGAHDREIFEFCWQNRTTFRLLFEGAGGASYAYLLDEFSERIAESAATWIGNAIGAGVHRPDLDPTVAARLLAGAYERLARTIVRAPKRPDIESWARQAQAIFMRGMLSDGARAELDRPVNHGGAGAPATKTTAGKPGTNGKSGGGSSPRKRDSRAGAGARATERAKRGRRA